MDRATLKRLLSQVESSIADGERRVVRQRQILSELDRFGLETATADRLLGTMLSSLHVRKKERDRILVALAFS
jgi:hypothetical protein